MSGGSERHRGLKTPTRERSHTRRTRSRSNTSVHRNSRARTSAGSHRRSRSRSHSRRLREREEALRLQQERLRLMEIDLQEARDSEQRRLRSEHRRKPSAAGRGHESRSRSRLQAARDSGNQASAGIDHRSRSGSPSFSSKDVIQIIQSIRDILPSQPSNPSTSVTSRGIDHKNIIPEFNPSEKNQRVDVWIKKVNQCAEVYGWDEKATVHFAMQKLTGLAKTWYESLSSILHTWEEWQVKLLNAFPSEQNYGQILEDMLKRKSRPNELIENYYYEKVALLNQCDIVGKKAVDCIIHGIGDRTMRSSALALRCEEPDQLLRFLLSNNKELSVQQPPVRDRNVPTVGDRPRNRSYQSNNSIMLCFNCKEKGHPFTRCPKPLLKCTHCDKIGHKAEVCRSKQGPGSTKADMVPKTMRISSSNPCNKFFKEVNVDGAPFEAFVDLGSEVTLIRRSVFESLGVIHDAKPTILRGFGNNVVHSAGSAILNISIDGVSASVPCRVVENQLLEKPILIGQTYTEQPHIVVYKDATKLQFFHIGAELPYPKGSEGDQTVERIRVSARCDLSGAASVRAATATIFTGGVVVDTKIVGKPNSQYVVCGGVYEVKDGTVFITVVPCSNSCRLQENLVFSRAERVETVFRLTDMASAPILNHDESLPCQPIDKDTIQLGDSVTDSDKARLFDLLQRYQGCFAKDLASLGCTNVAEMKIELSNQRPVVYRPYCLSHNEREKVRGMVDDMLEAGIIRESTSNYASPIILVRKKDGNFRLCVDYRQLNSVTVKERYPMPVIEDEIARLAGQAWFISLDLMSGYYQVPIAENSKHLTAFVTPDGQYEYNRMPFGLANAPAVFQRMMNHVLGPARFEKATVYIDDVLIYGKSPTECLDRFEEVLGLLQKANLKLNLSKCSFLQNEINYLGYEISSAGMRPGKAKIQSVVDFPHPENVHNVRQFLGLVSYFRKFIQGFAQLAYPLTKLLKKNRTWEWTDDQENSFKALKAKLIDRPVLAIYDPSAETELHADASRLGIGGILLQRPQGSEGPFHPVAYYSRQTSPEERNFHSYELETLAVICSLKKFRVFLLGKAFKIVSDCSALRSTFGKRDLIPRIARWWLALQEFHCSVEYRAGTKMGHVDALSRNPIMDVDNLNTDHFPSVMTINNDDWLLTLQLGDPELCRIRDIVSSDLNCKGLEYIREHYVIKDNKLFRRLNADNDTVRWVVPKGARWQLCKMNHDDIGHVGYAKTLERLKRNYWFAKMSRFVKKYVGACIDCAYSKKTSNSREGLLHPIEKVAAPFHTLHIDHLGPFVKSKRGNTHLLNIVDSFTKFVFIKPVKSTSTQNVIRVLEEVFDTFRTPDRVISDRGSCFTSHAFKRFCLDRGTKHILNAVASPRSNGQVERYNRTILDSLTAQNLREHEKEWDNKLGKIQWGLNNTIQKTIGRAPSEVMFGTGLNSEVNPNLNEITDKTRDATDLSTIRDEVKRRIDGAQMAQKRYHDQGRRPARTYNNGDLIKITKVAFQNDGKSTKLMPTYEGPFRVAKVLGNDRYKVAPIAGFEGMKRRKKTTVAADRMQPWIHVTSLGLDDDNTDNNVDAMDDDDASEDDIMSE